MDYVQFLEFCDACYAERNAVEAEYAAHPGDPWSLRSYADAPPNQQNSDEQRYLSSLFQDDGELALCAVPEQISHF